MNTDYDFIFKILLIGNTSVGKSSLLVRFADNIFSESFLPTIGVDFKIRTYEENGSIIKLQMWDTAGQEKFKTIIHAYYKGAHGILVVFDLTDKQSFLDIKNWLAEVDSYAPKEVRKVLIGNKADLARERQVNHDEAMSLAAAYGMQYLETSAKTDTNVAKAFECLTQEIKANIKTKTPITNPKIDIGKPLKRIDGKKNGTCC